MQGIHQNKFSEDNSGTLKVHCLPTVIAEGFHTEQSWFKVVGSLGENPFEIGKEGRIVQGPLRGFLHMTSVSR